LAGGKSARAIPIGIADRDKEPAQSIASAVAFIPLAREENGMDVVGAGRPAGSLGRYKISSSSSSSSLFVDDGANVDG
jgi:hypothetical protein